MDWTSLLVALVTGGPAIFVMFVHPVPKLKLPAAILTGFAFLALLAAFPGPRRALEHLASTSFGLAVIGGGAIVSIVWVLLEFFGKKHTEKMFGKSGHASNYRPAVAVMTMMLFAMLAFANLNALTSGFGSGTANIGNVLRHG